MQIKIVILNIEQGLINKQARRARRLNSGNKLQGINGMCYGTNKMILSDSNNSDSHSIDTCDIYLGSGGGAGYQNKGTAGGGAIIIECENGIFIGENASIIADGENSLDTYDSGCGGGGSIYIKTNTIVNNGIISAIGGINANGLNGCGSGGMGRIRIDCAGDKLEPTGNEKGIIRPRVGYSEVSKTRVS